MIDAKHVITKDTVEHAVGQAQGRGPETAFEELSERVKDFEAVQQLRRKAKKELVKAAKQVKKREDEGEEGADLEQVRRGVARGPPGDRRVHRDRGVHGAAQAECCPATTPRPTRSARPSTKSDGPAPSARSPSRRPAPDPSNPSHDRHRRSRAPAHLGEVAAFA